MMNRLKKVATFFLGLVILGGVGWLIFWLLQTLLQSLASADANVIAAVVAGSATVLASTLAVVLSRYFQAKKERESAHRDRKIELYDEFMAKLFELFLEDNPEESQEDLIPFLREIQRKLILWSGPETIKTYAIWHKQLTTSVPTAQHLIKLIDFFFALRKDLGHSNKGLEHRHMVRFLLRNSEKFMREYEKDPNVTFQQLAELEEKFAGTLSVGTGSDETD